MSTTAVVLLILAIAAIITVAVFISKQNKTKRLRHQFGPEYSRAVLDTGSARAAEATLQKVQKRVEQYHIRALHAEDRERFAAAWRAVQARFVDDPLDAVRQGDALLDEIMASRGYPISTFEQCTQDLSVDHPLVVEHYRAGRSIAGRASEGRASTEDLRQAMIHYRTLFEELVGLPASETSQNSNRVIDRAFRRAG